MNDVWEVCSICFDAFEDPVMLPCGHKLCMKCAQSMSSIIIGILIPYLCSCMFPTPLKIKRTNCMEIITFSRLISQVC